MVYDVIEREPHVSIAYGDEGQLKYLCAIGVYGNALCVKLLKTCMCVIPLLIICYT